jgi:hypothetical protein
MKMKITTTTDSISARFSAESATVQKMVIVGEQHQNRREHPTVPPPQ